MKCEHCKNSFKTKSSLRHHQKTAKYCLAKRNVINSDLVCESCSKSFSSKHWLNYHSIRCTKKNKNLNKQISKLIDENKQLKIINDMLETQLQEQKSMYEKQIQDLQNKLQEVALKAVSRPTTTNKTQINNFIQSMQPITTEHLLEHSTQLTLEHIQRGASGYAEYALEGPLKDRVACVDYARRKIKFKDGEGKIVTDPEMQKLAPMFFNSIVNKNCEIVFSQNTPDMDSEMFEQVAKLFNTNAEVKSAATGLKNDFYHDFVKHVCSGSTICDVP